MRVVCIDAAKNPDALEDCPLVRGSIYTVIDTITDAFGETGYLLAEAEPTTGFAAFHSNRFCPVEKSRKHVSFQIGADPDSDRWDNRKKIKERT